MIKIKLIVWIGAWFELIDSLVLILTFGILYLSLTNHYLGFINRHTEDNFQVI